MLLTDRVKSFCYKLKLDYTVKHRRRQESTIECTFSWKKLTTFLVVALKTQTETAKLCGTQWD